MKSNYNQSTDTEARRNSVLTRLLCAAQYDDNEIPTLKNYQYVDKNEKYIFPIQVYFVININRKIADPLVSVFQETCS